MNTKQVQRYVMRYLAATGCQILETSPAHVTVKLSPEADKDLTNRPYYWGFVERTGAEPETMTYTFVFDPEAQLPPQPQQKQPAPQPTQTEQPSLSPQSSGQPGQPPHGQPDSILGRYFGVTTTIASGFTGRIPKENVTFGSRRLDQLFKVALTRGRFVRQFEDVVPDRDHEPFRSLPYQTWLCINFKVELACDMKRDELHSLGIDLTSGEIRDRFMDNLLSRNLTPLLPPGIHVQPSIMTITRAVLTLENQLEKMIRVYDHSWAEEAWERLLDEQDRIDGYYRELLAGAEPETRETIEQQYAARKREIDWQYRPRIIVTVINCGLFHLQRQGRAVNDVSR